MMRRVILCAALAGLLIAPQQANAQSDRPQSVEDVRVPLRDQRHIGPATVRLSATQFTRNAPTIVLFGVDPERWPLIRQAIKQAAFEGYRVTGIFYGPPEHEPLLEIYADGFLVTRPINPNVVEGHVLTALIRDVVREYYSN